MEMLLKRGCKPDIADKQGVTPLHELAYNGHVKATKLLLAYGPRLDLRTQTGLTPVDTTDNSELKSIIVRLSVPLCACASAVKHSSCTTRVRP
eukprot:scaffold910_cov396-Prasinococcus_capsulatus_cf.AAC.30